VTSVDLHTLRATAALLAYDAQSISGWSIAPLVRARAIVAYLIEANGQRVVPLAGGTTLLANERRLAEHVFPARWFEASFVLVSLAGRVAQVSDARATNGALVRGEALPTARWASPVDGAAASHLSRGDAEARTQRLDPVWRELCEGEQIVARFPPASWVFVWAD